MAELQEGAGVLLVTFGDKRGLPSETEVEAGLSGRSKATPERSEGEESRQSVEESISGDRRRDERDEPDAGAEKNRARGSARNPRDRLGSDHRHIRQGSDLVFLQGGAAAAVESPRASRSGADPAKQAEAFRHHASGRRSM